MGTSPPLGPRLRSLLAEHFRLLLTLAPRERPDLLVLVFVIALVVLIGYAIAYAVGI